MRLHYFTPLLRRWPLLGLAALISLIVLADPPAAEAQSELTPSRLTVIGTSVSISFDSTLDTGSEPATSAFTVKKTPLGSTTPATVSVTDVEVGVSVVTLTLTSAVLSGDTVTVTYTKPASNPLRGTTSGNPEVASFNDEAVTNRTPPLFSSASVNVTSLTITFDGNLAAAPNLANSAFTVKKTASGSTSATPVSLTGTPSISGQVVTLTLASAVAHTDTVTVSYTVPTSGTNNKLKNVSVQTNIATGDVATFTDKPVNNNTPPPPVVSSAAVRGTSLRIRFNERLAAAANLTNSAFTVKVNGSSVTLSGTPSIGGIAVTLTLTSAMEQGDTVTVRYTKPTSGTNNKLKGTTGSEVASFANDLMVYNDQRPPIGPGYSIHCSDYGNWYVSGDIQGNPGARSGIACDMAKPGWIFEWNRPGYIKWVYRGDRVVTPYTTSSGTIGTRYEPIQGGNARPPVNQPVADGTHYDAFTYNADANNRAVRGADGQCYRERRVSGRWQRSDAYRTDPNNFMDACHRASWNAFYRWRNLPLVYPASITLFPSGPAPAIPSPESAAVDETTLTMTFNENLDTDSLPSHGAFRVTVNNARRSVASGGVAVSGQTVTLTLASEVGPTDTVRVRYTKQSRNPLLGAAGIAVFTFDDQAVTNNTPEGIFWSATLTVGVISDTAFYGCEDGASAPCTSGLSRNSFTHQNSEYQVKQVTTHRSGSTKRTRLTLQLDNAISQDWTLHVEGRQLPVADATLSNSNKTAYWDDPGINLAALLGQQVPLRLTAPPPLFQIAAVDGTTLTITFSSDLDEEASLANSAFVVKVGGSSVGLSTTTGPSISGKTVTLTLASGVASTDTVTVSYTQPTSGTANALKNAIGKAASFTDQAVTNNTGAGGAAGDSGGSEPAVTGVTVISSAGADKTYGLGDTIHLRVTFDGPVDVTGTPRLKIDMDPAEWGEKWAAYASGSGTSSLTFAHTVVEPNISTQGIAVLANTLELNGGTIRASGTEADLAHTGQPHDANHKVDWQTEPESGGGGGPTGTSDPPGGAGGDGGSQQEQSAPASVSGLAIASDPGDDDTYASDDVISITVTFSKTVDVTGAPRLKIDMDPAEWGEKWAAYQSGSGTATLTFSHTVVEPNISTQGIAVLASTLELNGGTIQASGVDADLAHTGLAHDANHKVDWQTEPESDTSSDEGGASGDSGGEQEQSAPASVSGASVSSSPASGNTYGNGETISITLTFSEAVDVTGTPRLKIDLDPADGGEQWVAYASGSGTATLTFAYTVAEPNISTQGIAVLANTLELNGGTVQADGVDANLAQTALAHDDEHKVDWRLPEASVTGVEITSDPGDDDTYASDDVISITLTFSKTVDVTGTPRLKIDMDPAEWGEKWAAYQGGSGTTILTFTHTVVEPNISTQGIAVLANTLELNGGTMQSDSLAALLAHTGLAHDAEHKVDWQLSEESDTSSEEGGASGDSGSEQDQSAPASVSGAAVASSPASANTYALGETIQITLTFSEAVNVTGTPRLKIDMDPAEWGEKWAAYQSGSGTATLTFTHTVVEPNISTQGIAVLANTLELNGGTIQASGVDAGLSHTALGHNADHKVDWRLPAASVTGVEITSDPGGDDTYASDDVIRITLTFSKTVDVTGTPRLKIDMDPAEWGEKWAAYQGGSGTSSLTFTHTVVEPNYSTQGIAVLENSLELNGGTMQSDGLAALLSHTGLAHDADHKVDWQLSQEGGAGS